MLVLTQQAHSCLRAFGLAVPSVWTAIQPDLPRAHFLTPFTREAFPNQSINRALPSVAIQKAELSVWLVHCWVRAGLSFFIPRNALKPTTPRTPSSNTLSPPSAHSPPNSQHVPLPVIGPNFSPRLPSPPQRDTQMMRPQHRILLPPWQRGGILGIVPVAGECQAEAGPGVFPACEAQI